MEVHYSTEKLIPRSQSVLTVGSYDGLHLGHQKLLNTLVENAIMHDLESVCITFDPHPRSIIERNPNNFSLIMNLNQKLSILEKLGLNFVYVIKFTKKFSNITAADFMSNIIIPKFNPKIILTGVNHFFGKKRQGSISFLKKYGKKNNIDIVIVKPVMDRKIKISSSNIRRLLGLGDIKGANKQLGTFFTVQGKIINGSGRGRSLNFPTANVKPEEKIQLFPKIGVYLVRGRINGFNAFGMCNIGIRPTFGEKDLVMEIHFFLDMQLNLYGKRIIVEFLERIRDEKVFPSSKDLIKQLEKDKRSCLSLLSKYK